MGRVVRLHKKRLKQIREEEDDRHGLMIGLRNGILLVIPLWALIIWGLSWLF